MKKVRVIARDGLEITLEQWQQTYGLEIGSDSIGVFFSLNESRFKNDITAFGEIVVNVLLIRVLDGFRALVDQPVTINSFNRSEEYQVNLKARGFKTATYSPHVAKMAADIETKTPEQTRQWVKLLEKVSDKMHIKVRIGSEQYLKAGQTFIHVDVCPEYYAVGKPFNKNFHPVAWEVEARW